MWCDLNMTMKFHRLCWWTVSSYMLEHSPIMVLLCSYPPLRYELVDLFCLTINLLFILYLMCIFELRLKFEQPFEDRLAGGEAFCFQSFPLSKEFTKQGESGSSTSTLRTFPWAVYVIRCSIIGWPVTQTRLFPAF